MKTKDDLFELDREELVAELSKASGIEIGEIGGYSDLQLSTWHTADGYDVYVLMNGQYMSDMNWESDVYYYEPPISEILDRFSQLEPGDKFYVDADEYLTDEEAIIEYLIDNYPELYTDEYDEE